jgi:hypothetical protein
MKQRIYFHENGSTTVGYFSDDSVLHDYTDSFELDNEQSHFAARYACIDGELVDNFEGKTDDEVIAVLNAKHDVVSE